MKIERSNIESVQESSFNNPDMTLEKWLTLNDTEKFNQIKQVEGANVNSIPKGWDYLGGGADRFVKGDIDNFSNFLKVSLLPRIQKEIDSGGVVIAARPSEIFNGMDPEKLNDAYIFLKKIDKGNTKRSTDVAILSKTIVKDKVEKKEGPTVSELLRADRQHNKIEPEIPEPISSVEKVSQPVKDEIVPERQIPKEIPPVVEDKKNDNEIKINTLKQEIIEKTLTPEEKTYYENHAYLAVKEINSIESSIKSTQEDLDRANKKGFFSRDKKEIQKLENDIADLNIKLNIKKQFSEKQKEFLKNNPSIHLEGKTEQEVEQIILNHPQVFTMLMGAYEGLDIQKVMYKGEEFSNAKHYLDLNTVEFRHDYGLLGDYKKYEAFPGHLDFPQGKGFGIIFKNRDFVNRDGFSSVWAVIPEYEKNLAQYLDKHPEIFIDLLKKKFMHDSGGNMIHNNRERTAFEKSIHDVSLVSKEFVDMN